MCCSQAYEYIIDIASIWVVIIIYSFYILSSIQYYSKIVSIVRFKRSITSED